MRVVETLTFKNNRFQKAFTRSLLLALLLLAGAAIANAQTPVPAQSSGTSTHPSSSSSPSVVEKNGQDPAQTAKSGTVIGTVLDQTSSVAAGAVVRLTSEDKSFSQEVTSGDDGQFSFTKVPPGPFKIAVKAEGFGDQQFSGELAAGQTYLMPPIVIAIAAVVTDVKVTVDPIEVATQEVKLEEQQRILGFIPNFYVSYTPDAAPLTTKLKYHLAWKSTTDVITIAGVAFLAGLQQAGDQYPEFGQGAEGYAKRFGADYADAFVSTFLSGAVLPSILKQDPRYYYRGTGSNRSRIVYAISNSVRCKGDNGRWQVNYSNIAGSVGGAAISSTYYPTTNRGINILENSFIRMGESSLSGVLQEFVLRKLTKGGHRQASSAPPATDTASTANRSNP